MPVPETEIVRRIEQFRAESNRAMKRAGTLTSRRSQAEYLKLAGEWLMLADETANSFFSGLPRAFRN